MPRWNDTPMVGRAAELATLMTHVDRAVEGRPSAVLLSGDAGVGKTRLLDELAAVAAEHGVRVLTGHCVDLGDVGLPYLPFVDLLRPVAADPGLAPTTAALPALTDLLGGSAATVARGDAAAALPDRSLRPALDDGRLQLFESVALLLGELAAASPLLIVIEDLHWADRSSRDLLRYLLARLVDEPVVVVVSYRSDDLHRRHPLRPLLAELLRLPVVAHLELRQLPDPAIAELVRNLTDSDRVDPAALADVVARAEGNAFYAEELVAAGLDGESLPGALADLLLARVERVGAQAQQVLRAAAVAGRRVRHDLLAAVSGLPPVDLDRALAEAVGHHLLISDGHRYRFRHALLREAVLTDLLPGERVRLHAAVAAYLRDEPAAGTAAERAHHARESNDLPGAFTATLEAAEEARRGGAPAEQLLQLEAALALWPAVRDAAERAGRGHAELLLETALAARAGGDVHRAVALLGSARDALADSGDPLIRARVHYTLAMAFIWLDDFAAAYAESSAAMALVPARPPSPARTWAAATHARTAYYMGARAESDAAAEEALGAADALGLDAAWADTAASLARMHSGEDAAVRARLEEALVRARRSRDVDVEMRVLFNLAIDAYESGDLAATVTWSRTAVEQACALGVEWSFYPAELRHLLVVSGYMTGDWDAALAAAQQLARVPDMAAHVRAAGLLVQVGRGDPDAGERLSWARGLSERLSGPVMLMVTAAAAEVERAGWAGDAETAVRRAAEASRRLGELWPVDRLAAVRLAALALSAAADAAAEARLRGEGGKVAHWTEAAGSLTALADEAEAAYRAGGWPIGPEGRAWRGRLEAEAARLAGDPAPERWRASVEGFGRLGHVYEQARSRWRLAEALLAVDERTEATAHLREAHAVAIRLGAAPLREAVEALARRARLGAELPGGRDPEASAVLTPREAEVLALLAQGRTNRQIGAALYISEKTASVHVSNILAKLSAGSRTEAVAIAAHRGLLPAAGARPG